MQQHYCQNLKVIPPRPIGGNGHLNPAKAKVAVIQSQNKHNHPIPMIATLRHLGDQLPVADVYQEMGHTILTIVRVSNIVISMIIGLMMIRNVGILLLIGNRITWVVISPRAE